MKKQRKALSLLLAGAMAVSLLAGCGDGGNANEDPEKENTENNEGEDSENGDEEPVVLKWVFPAGEQEDAASVLEKVNEIIEPKIGATLELEFVEFGAYADKLNMYMSSGADFDLCYTSNWCNDYVQAVAKGGLYPLDELIENNTTLLKDAIPEYAWEGTKIGGEIYAVPNIQIMTTGNAYYILKDVAEKYGFEGETADPEMMEAFLEKVKAGEADLIPYLVDAGNFADTLSPWLTDYEVLDSTLGIGVKEGSSEDVTACVLYETEEFKDAIATLRDWYQKGYIREDVASVGDQQADLNSGRIAVYISRNKPGGAASDSAMRGQEFIMVPFETPLVTTGGILSTMTGINKNSEHPEKAIQFLELLFTDQELYRLLAYGIEGTHYTTDENGQITYIENSGYKTDADWAIGNTFMGYSLAGQEVDVLEQTEAMNDSATKSPVLGFTFDASNIQSEYAQIASVVAEYNLLWAGTLDPEESYDEFIEKLYSAGMQTVVDEYNRQIQEFMATK